MPQQPRQGLFPLQQPTELPQSLCLVRACSPPSNTQSTLLFPMLYIKTEKKRKFVILFFTQLQLVSKKNRFSTIAKLVNAPAIHNQKIVVRLFQVPPASHRAQTEPLHQKPPQGLVFTQLPTDPPIIICLVRACLPPSSTQSTLSFNGIYKNSEKRKFVILFFAHLQLVSKKCGFRKLQN